MLTQRTTCRACGSSALTEVIELGAQQLASNFHLSPKFPPVEREIPLTLVRCDPQRDERACGLVQLAHTVPPTLMYASYGYRSGTNATMREHLAGIAAQATRVANPKEDDLIVDIGSNDGTLLGAYQARGARLIGFEPSDVKSEHIHSTCKDFFSVGAYWSHIAEILNLGVIGLARAVMSQSTRRAKIITSIAMFYDLEDPNEFVRSISLTLAHDGIWIFEMSYLPSMLANASFDTICHEHLEYYALGPIEKLLEKHGLVVADAELNDANGGSIRVTACHRDSVHATQDEDTRARLYDIRRREFELRLDTDAPYARFRENVAAIRGTLAGTLAMLRAQGNVVYGYGASTKGNVILQYCGITSEHLTAIADRNPVKVGGLTVGSNIPICSEEEMRAAKPDYLLVLPWHFMEEFRAREEEFALRGGKFIVPVPKVEIS